MILTGPLDDCGDGLSTVPVGRTGPLPAGRCSDRPDEAHTDSTHLAGSSELGFELVGAIVFVRLDLCGSLRLSPRNSIQCARQVTVCEGQSVSRDIHADSVLLCGVRRAISKGGATQLNVTYGRLACERALKCISHSNGRAALRCAVPCCWPDAAHT